VKIQASRFKVLGFLIVTLTVSAASAIGAGTAAAAAGTPAASKAFAAGSRISGDVYLYSNSSFGAVCNATNAIKHTYTTCANKDKSLYNAVSGYRVRFYYGANETGAWICFDDGDSGSSTGFGGAASHLKFDQGRGRAGFGKSIWDHVRSEELVKGAIGCRPDE
jgi:hypothetical protein